MSLTFAATNFFFRATAGAYNLPGTALTIHCWIQPDTVASTAMILGRWGALQSRREYILELTNTAKIAGSIAGASTDTATGATSLSTGAWRAIGMRKNGTGAGALAVFLDGVSDGSNSSNSSIQSISGDSGSQFRIGLASDSTLQYAGQMAECAIWNAALSDNEMLSLGKGASPSMVRPNSLIGYWTMYADLATQPDMSGSTLGTDMTRLTSLPLADHAPVAPPPAMLVQA